ncbi:MAG: TIGR03435 family protein [Terracidiphilus sp.]|jgi:uncharacterized protein (TIGR03435 family)
MNRLNRRHLVLCAAALAVLAAQPAFGQSTAPAPNAAPAPDSAPESKHDAPSLPAFEVAVIKPNKSGGGHSHSGFDNGRFTAENISPKILIQYDAYAIPGPQILGGPDWLASQRFDIDAKVDDQTAESMDKLPYQQRSLLMRQLVQQLLADRFKLAVHWEQKELPVYALVSYTKPGLGLHPAKDPDKGNRSSNNGSLTDEGVTMTDVARQMTQILNRELGRVVIDKTGLQGKYDLALTWSPDNHSANFTNGSADTAAPIGPSIFTAVKEQLGLKLESAKAPVDVLVIDHIEAPSEN